MASASSASCSARSAAAARASASSGSETGCNACELRSVTVCGASDTSAATPSNTVWQWPQRTWPARIASCCGVTRKIVLHPGQRVNLSSATVMFPAARQCHPSFVLLPYVDSKPSRIGRGDLRRLRVEYAGQHDVAARAHPSRQQRREHHQRVGEDVGDDDVEGADTQR